MTVSPVVTIIFFVMIMSFEILRYLYPMEKETNEVIRKKRQENERV